MTTYRTVRVLAATLLVAAVLFSSVAGGAPIAPGPKDRCPVCGMFVAPYPEWVSVVKLGDGSVHFFDGVRDMAVFLGDLGKYRPGGGAAVAAMVQVTDYYALEPIDGLTARYVSGSDVFGPMGVEYIPFAREEQAREFLRDHRGQKIIGFDQVLELHRKP